jgi:ABC-2 type transport system permease protein
MREVAPVPATPAAPDPATEPAPSRPAQARVPMIQAVYAIWYRDVLRYWRDRARLAVSLVQPVLYLLVFGVGLSSALGGGRGLPPGVTYIQYMYPGVIGMAVLFTATFSAMSVVWDRELGFLREILVAPISRPAVVIGKALGGTTQAMVQGLVILALAPLAGVKLSVAGVLELVPLLFVLAFALTCLGLAVASRLKSMQGFQMVMNLLMMPMFFLSGAMFPLRGLPAWLAVLTRFDPLAYGMAPIRIAVLGGAGVPPAVLERFTGIAIAGHTLPALADVLILLAAGVVCLGIAIRAMRRPD